MQYKIQVYKISPKQSEDRYSVSEEIYSQIVEEIDLLAVIRAANPEPQYKENGHLHTALGVGVVKI